MDMKYYYKQEKSGAQLLCHGFGILVLMMGFISTVKLPFDWDRRENFYTFGSTEWFLSLVPIVLFALFAFAGGRILGRNKRHFRKWHQYLVSHGTKCRGQVTKVLVRQSVSSSDHSGQISYSFRVSYYSPSEDRQVEFETPALSFSVSEQARIYCDVYEVTDLPPWAEHRDNHTDDLIQIEGRKICFTFNPVKLFLVVMKQSEQQWFGNVIADHFEVLD